MLISENILRANVDSLVISSAYKGISKSIEAIASGSTTDKGMAALAIRELLRGEIAANQQAARNANDAVSMVQTFDAAATTISVRLARMKGLAEQVIDGLYWSKGKAGIQKELEELAGEINNIAENTKYDGNKFFTDEGKTISVPISNGSAIQIFASDLRVDTKGLDLTTDAVGALEALQEKIKNTNEYIGYLSIQAGRLEEAMATIELEFGKTLEVEWSDFDTISAGKIVINAASKFPDDKSTLLAIQANVTPTAAKRLLEYKGPYI